MCYKRLVATRKKTFALFTCGNNNVFIPNLSSNHLLWAAHPPIHCLLPGIFGNELIQGDFSVVLVDGDSDAVAVAGSALAERAQASHEHPAAMAQPTSKGFGHSGPHLTECMSGGW